MYMDLWSTLILALIWLFSLLILYKEGLCRKLTPMLTGVVLITVAFFLRHLCMNHETADYQIFLTKWVSFFRQRGGFIGLRQSMGNYNIPYLSFLALFSYSAIRDLYLIKLLSIFFDVLLAWGGMRLVSHFTGRKPWPKLAAFVGTLLLPTVILNGAYWGQCDGIYAAFAVWSVYFALADKPYLSVAAIAASLAFKLQAVFVMPVFLIFWFAGKVRLRHLLTFPLSYFIWVLPAVLAGRPVIDTITLYFNQAETVGSALNYNSPSVFALIRGDNPETLAKLGILAAFLFLALLYLYLYARRKSLSDFSLLVCAVLIPIAVPFFLPHMHDRYFFVADVMTFFLAAAAPVYLPLPVLTSFASLICYHAYLKGRFLIPLKNGALALTAVITVLLIVLISRTDWEGRTKRY